MAWDDSATRWAVCWAHLAVLLTTPHPPRPINTRAPVHSAGRHSPGLPAWGVTLTPWLWTSCLGGHTHTTAPDFPPRGSRSHHGPARCTSRPRQPDPGSGVGCRRAHSCRSGVHRAPWGPWALPATGSEQTRWCVASQTRSEGAPQGLEARGKQQGLDTELGPALRDGTRPLSTSQHVTPSSLGSPFPCPPACVQERGTSSWTTSATSLPTDPPHWTHAESGPLQSQGARSAPAGP